MLGSAPPAALGGVDKLLLVEELLLVGSEDKLCLTVEAHQYLVNELHKFDRPPPFGFTPRVAGRCENGEPTAHGHSPVQGSGGRDRSPKKRIGVLTKANRPMNLILVPEESLSSLALN
jgi:hypothetical protein